MSDVELAIKIPEEIYNHTQEYEVGGFNQENDTKLFIAIKNGTPLPKEHGALKDADKIKASMFAYMMDKSKSHEAKSVMSVAKSMVDLEKPIIEASMGERKSDEPLKWEPGNRNCPCCGEDKFKDLDADIWSDWRPKYCPNCGAKMIAESEAQDADNN